MDNIDEQIRAKIVRFYDDNPFVRFLDMKIVKVEAGETLLELTIKPDTHTNVYGIAHGGAIMSLSDTAMGAACLSVNKKVVTIEMNMNCLKAVPAGMTVQAVGKIVHNGGKVVVAETEVSDAVGNLYAKARGSFYVLGKLAETV